jgi:hypothetical protein
MRSGTVSQTLPGFDGGQCSEPFLTPVSMNHIDACYPFSDPALIDDLVTLNPQSVSLPTSQDWGNNEWQCSPILEVPVTPVNATNATIHDLENNIRRFPPTPPITQSCLVLPIQSTPYYHLQVSDHPNPYVPEKPRPELTEFRCEPPAASSASRFKLKVASDAIKKSSKRRRKHEAKFVCGTCGDDFTAKHNLGSKCLTSACVCLY